ncbi:MAG: phosphatidylserine decarboxylase [Phycisphaerales bacterium]|nr:phosphatidylserine decarboxylase [Phycisphaerales bacterium]
MLLASYAKRDWLTATIIAAALIFICILIGFWWLGIPVFIIWFAFAAFFRDPIRRIDKSLGPEAFLSPADGVITKVEQLDEHEAVDGPAVLIRIFLSLLDVHVNRAPCDGQVLSSLHRPGLYLHAGSPEAAEHNESQLLTLRWAPSGEQVGMRLVSGMIARRIVCPLVPGDEIVRGRRFGMIKLGSTAELILPRPDQVTVLVKEGQKVRGGKTVLANLEVVPA